MLHQPRLSLTIAIIFNVVVALLSSADAAGASSGPARRRWDCDRKLPKAPRALNPTPLPNLGGTPRRTVFAGIDSSKVTYRSAALTEFHLDKPSTHKYVENLDNRKAVAILGLKTPGKGTASLPKMTPDELNKLVQMSSSEPNDHAISVDLDLKPELEKLAKIKLRAPVLQSYQSLPNPERPHPPQSLRRSVSDKPQPFRRVFGIRNSERPVETKVGSKDEPRCLYGARKPSPPGILSPTKDFHEPDVVVAAEPVEDVSRQVSLGAIDEVVGQRRRFSGVFGSRPGSR